MRTNEMSWGKQIEWATQKITEKHGLHAEIVPKTWPADGIVYVRLYTDDGREEWTLITADSDYDKTFIALQRPALRLAGGEADGL